MAKDIVAQTTPSTKKKIKKVKQIKEKELKPNKK